MTRLERRRDALQMATSRPPVATTSTPCALRNALNGSGGTTKGARYAANARRAMERGVGRRLALRLARELPADAAVVVLTRVSPRPFDDDGTTASLKSVRDGMAEWWGIDDADPRVTWETDWRKGKAHVVEASLWFVPLPKPKRGLAALAGAMPDAFAGALDE